MGDKEAREKELREALEKDHTETVEELRAKLTELKILKEGMTSGKVELPRDISADELEYMQKGAAMMSEVQKLLEGQVAKDRALIQDLHLKVKKIKHGGGI